MAQFKPVRYSGTPTTPVTDGQMLVDRGTGLVSFDIGTTRVRPNNIYGVVSYVSSDQWVLNNDVYEVNTATLAGDDIPEDFSPVGASLMASGAYGVRLENGIAILMAHQPLEGSVLLFCLPGRPKNTPDTINIDDTSYAMSINNGIREWDAILPVECESAISLTDGSSENVLMLEDETATGADRVWSI